MSTNKHASIRYQALDRCFSNMYRRHYIQDLIDACNEVLQQHYGEGHCVQRRQIFDDISHMESEAGYSIVLDKKKDGRRTYYRYADPSFSINKRPLSHSEAELLKNTVLMLKRFNGLPQFSYMEECLARLEKDFNLNGSVANVVSFEQNPYLSGMEHFTGLFNAIINQQVLEIEYKAAFGNPDTYTIHPYHLKQYNNRWFLFGLNTTTGRPSIMNLSLDRICGFEDSSATYIAPDDYDFNEYFDDVVGVSVPHNRPVETIRLRIDKKRFNYIASKPIHSTQRIVEREEDHITIELKLIPNYEFETLLLGFADTVEILQPDTLRAAIHRRAKNILERNSL